MKKYVLVLFSLLSFASVSLAAIFNNTISGTQNVCTGSVPTTLNGSTPTGGTGFYFYQWISSTTNASSGFTNASGASNNISYSPAALTSSTWYRRIVISGGDIDTSAAVALTVLPLPIPITSPNAATQCSSGNSFVFSNTSTMGAPYFVASYFWDFGNGTTSTNTFPNPVTYTAAGTYSVKLVATSNNGCKDSLSQNVTVLPSPAVSFSINSSAQCLTLNNFIFSDNSTVSPALLSRLWSFGDGATSSASNPTKTYSSAGAYSVKLVLASTNGCSDSLSQSVSVQSNPTATAAAAGPTTFCQGTSVTLNANTGAGLSYQWRNNGITISGATSSSYVATATGNYNVVVSTSGGCSDSSAAVAVVVNSLPTATVTPAGPLGFCQGLSTTLSANTGAGLSYQWRNNGVNISGQTATTLLVSASGNYRVVVTNSNSCVDSSNAVSVTVNPLPTATASASGPTTFCPGSSVSLNANTGAGLSYQWRNNGVNISGANSATYVAAASGNYKVVVTDANLCSDSSATVAVTLNANPVPIFSVNNSSQCFSGNSFSFTNTSVGIVSSAWTFGDGSTSSLTNPVKSYASASVYSVKLVVTGSSGCSDSLTQSLTVAPQPAPSFTINAATQCLSGNSYAFTNTSGISFPYFITSYVWDFGNGSTSGSAFPSFQTYATAGTYSVKLVATSNSGCKDSITQNVMVLPSPAVSFGINTVNQCFSSHNFAFNDNSIVSPALLSRLWSFGDGNTSSLSNPSKTYSAIGAYSVKLVITSTNGCSDSLSQTVSAEANPLATASAAGPQTFCQGGSVSINANTGSGLSYQWRNNSINITGAVGPTYVATSSGNYKVVVTNTAGCSDSSTVVAVTVNSLPTASVSPAGFISFCQGQSSTLNANTGTGLSYQWRNNGINISGETNSSYVASTNGNYRVVVTNSNGCTDSSFAVNVTVNPLPTASISAGGPTTFCPGNSVTLTANTGTGFVYQWRNNGVNISGAISSSYSATSVGNYKVVVSNTNGCTDSSNTIAVNLNSNPVPSFTINNNIQCLGANNFVFSNTSVGITSSTWSFGDGGSSSLTNPTRNYTTSGTYNVTLVVTNSSACVDSLIQSVTVMPHPVSLFTINSATQCLSANGFVFSNTSTMTAPYFITSYAWNFGNDSISNNAFPTIQRYLSAGTYAVKLTVSGNNGCVDSLTQTVTVLASPVVSFGINQANQCFSSHGFVFNDNSTVVPALASRLWDFGDATTSVLANPSKTYSAAGSYPVKLVLVSTNGCSDSLTQIVSLSNNPAATTSAAGSTTFCMGGSVAINANVGPGLSYQWRNNGSNISGAVGPTYVATTSGNYKVVVTNSTGCVDSSTIVSVVVNNPPATVVSPSGFISICQGQSITLSANTASGFSYQWRNNGINISGETNPSLLVTAEGNYKVVITDANSCTDSSFAVSVTLNTKPTATVTPAGATTFCPGSSVALMATGGSGFVYQWRKNGIAITGEVNSSYVANSPGDYSVIITNTSSCSDTSTATTVAFLEKPVSAFSVNTSSQCLSGNSFSFTNASSIGTGTLSAIWHFGDGTTAVSTNSSKTYTSAGIYTVKLITLASNGCLDSNSSNVTVMPQPLPLFNTTNPTQCLKENSFAFTNNATVDFPYFITSYFWDFGNGNTSASAFPGFQSYSSSGIFNVKLVTTTNTGCKDSSTAFVTVLASPVVTFSVNQAIQCFSGHGFVFNDNSTLGAGLQTRVWDFGDGTTAGIPNPSKVYAIPDTFTVKLTLTLTNGCVDSMKLDVRAENNPAVSITPSGSTTFCLGSSVLLNANTGSGFSYQWRKDGVNLPGAIGPSLMVTTAGNYKVVVTNSAGCSDSSAATAVVVNNLPLASISPSGFLFVCEGQSLNLNANSGSGLTYQWRNNGVDITGETNSTYPATAAGNYKVVVTNSNGCTDSSFAVSVVVNSKPSSGISAGGSTSFCPGGSVVLNASTGSGVVYQWLLNGSAISGANNNVYVASLSGNYRVVQTNTNACSDTSAAISVTLNSKPSTAFTVNGSTQCFKGNRFIFTDNSIGAVSYVWDFDDGSNATLPNPVKAYATDGTYTVKLVTTAATGCSDSLTQLINVLPSPVPSFSLNSSTQCFKGNVFNFTNTSTIAAPYFNSAYAWDFGNGITSNFTNVFGLVYASVGSYNAKLVVTSNNGCKDSITQTISVLATPVVKLSVNDSTQCFKNHSFEFSDSSLVNPATLSRIWYFGDGDTSTAQHPVKTYLTDSVYYVKLIVASTNGCVDSATRIIEVSDQPVASITPMGSTNFCAGESLTLLATSGAGLSYQWRKDGVDLTGQVLSSYVATGSGSYTVVIGNSGGCVDSSAALNITVSSIPSASISPAGFVAICPGTTTTLSANIGSGLSYQWRNNGVDISGANGASYNAGTLGNYRVVVTNSGGCSDSSAVVVVWVNAAPAATATASGATIFCPGGSVNLSANTGTGLTHQWTNNGSIISGASSSTYMANASGNYRVVVTNGQGCYDSSAAIAVLVPDLPVVNIHQSSPISICDGSMTTLTTSFNPTYAYQWRRNGLTITGATDTTLLIGISGNYSLLATNGFGCIDSSSVVSVSIGSNPLAIISPPGPLGICPGSSTNLFANTGAGLSYQWRFNSQDITGATTSVLNAKNAGDYKVVVTNAAGCSDSSSAVNIGLHGLPTANAFATGPTNFCQGGGVFLNANFGPGYNYQWRNNGASIIGGNTLSYFAYISGNYKVVVTDANGCVDSSAFINVNVLSSPVVKVTPSGTNLALCPGGTINLKADSAAGYTFQWRNSLGDMSGETFSSYTVISKDTFKIVITNASGCVDSSAAIIVGSGSLPLATVFPSGSVFLCPGKSVTLIANAGVGLSYSWRNNGVDISGATGVSYNTSAEGNYKVVVTNLSGCVDSSASVAVTLMAYPSAPLSAAGITTFCEGDSVILFTNNVSGQSYQWFRNDIGLGNGKDWYYAAKSSGNYKVRVFNGCDSTSALLPVTVHPKPVKPVVSQSGNQVISTLANSYQWYRGDTLLPGATTQIYPPGKTGVYAVVVSNSFGCSNRSDNFAYTHSPIGVDELKDIAFSAAPNPFVDAITVLCNACLGNNVPAQIYDVAGKLVYETRLNTADNKLDLSSITHNGIYFLKLEGKMHKLIKE